MVELRDFRLKLERRAVAHIDIGGFSEQLAGDHAFADVIVSYIRRNEAALNDFCSKRHGPSPSFLYQLTGYQGIDESDRDPQLPLHCSVARQIGHAPVVRNLPVVSNYGLQGFVVEQFAQDRNASSIYRSE